LLVAAYPAVAAAHPMELVREFMHEAEACIIWLGCHCKQARHLPNASSEMMG
jgi:hypothetical protein